MNKKSKIYIKTSLFFIVLFLIIFSSVNLVNSSSTEISVEKISVEKKYNQKEIYKIDIKNKEEIIKKDLTKNNYKSLNSWNNDNIENETFIIKSDLAEYKCVDEVWTYLSVNNTKKITEEGKILINLEPSMRLSNISVFKDKTWITLKQYKSTTLIPLNKTVDKYDDFIVSCPKNMTDSKDKVCYTVKKNGTENVFSGLYYDTSRDIYSKRKDIGPRFALINSYYNFTPGITIIRAQINIKPGIEGDFKPEIFGADGGYGHLDPSINSTPGLDVDFMNYYNLDSDTLDSVGSDDATATSITAYSPCKVGDCYYWNGEDNRLTIPNTAYLDSVFGGSHYTVNFWLNTSDTGADVFSKSEGTFVKWTEVLFSGGSLYYYIDDAANRRGTSPAVTGVNDGNWHMVSMRRYAGGFSLSIDSVEVATNTESLGDATNTKDIYFGDNNYLQGLIGYIDEIGFWNRSLTQTEINQLYNSSDGCNPVVSNYCVPATTTTTTTTTTTSTSTTSTSSTTTTTIEQVEFVNGTTASNLASVGGVYVFKPNGVQEDDFLIASCINIDNLYTWTAPTGWTEIFQTQTDLGSDRTTAVFYKKANASEDAGYTFTIAPNGALGVMITAYRNVDTINPLDVPFDPDNSTGHIIIGENNAKPPNAPITTVSNNTLILVTEHITGVIITGLSAPSGYSAIKGQSGSTLQQFVASKAVFEIGTESPGNWTNNGAVGDYTDYTIALRYKTDTCVCPGIDNNWEIDCNAFCDISDCEIGTGNISLFNSGFVSTTGNINVSNINKIDSGCTLYLNNSNALINI